MLHFQICELTYEKQIDFSTVDLKKLKVKDLKKILNDWDETCDGCLEKGDFIRKFLLVSYDSVVYLEFDSRA